MSTPFSPGKSTVYGAPCADSRGHLSHIGWLGQVVIGKTGVIALDTAPARAPTFLAVGPRVNLSIGRCPLLASPVIILTNEAADEVFGRERGDTRPRDRVQLESSPSICRNASL